MEVQVNPNEDTEWYARPSSINSSNHLIPGGIYVIYVIELTPQYRNDILRKHGIIPEKAPDPEPAIQEAILEAQRRAHENRLEDKDLDELNALEDEEDDEFLEQYRYESLPSLSHTDRAYRLTALKYLDDDDPDADCNDCAGWPFQQKTPSRALHPAENQHPQPSLPDPKSRLRARSDRSVRQNLCTGQPDLLVGRERERRVPRLERSVAPAGGQVWRDQIL